MPFRRSYFLLPQKKVTKETWPVILFLQSDSGLNSKFNPHCFALRSKAVGGIFNPGTPLQTGNKQWVCWKRLLKAFKIKKSFSVQLLITHYLSPRTVRYRASPITRFLLSVVCLLPITNDPSPIICYCLFLPCL